MHFKGFKRHFAALQIRELVVSFFDVTNRLIVYWKNVVLLHRCQFDTDDEVRDRATYYKTILQKKIQVDVFVFNDLDVSLACLERSLVDYVSNQDCSEEFNLNSVQKQQYHAKKGPVSSHLLVRDHS